MSPQQLRPCPFCGQPASIDTEKRHANQEFHTIGCNTERCRESHWNQVIAFPTDEMEQQIAMWNRRCEEQ